MFGRPSPRSTVVSSALICTARRLVCLLTVVSLVLMAWPALADVRVINAAGEHRMGERDTREDAIRLATEAAKRNALEQVATYLESVTIVDGMDVTKDEIRTYTAGLVLVLNQQITTSLDGDVVVIRADLLTQMDTEEVARAITTLRENEDARVQLAELKQENEQLQEELRAANQALGTASTTEQVYQASQKRKEILNRVQSNAMVSQAWTNWVLVSPVGIPQGLLNSASGLFPANPHIAIAQQIIAYRQPQGASFSRPGSRPGRMPNHELVPPPGAAATPRTFSNEMIHRTPPGRPQGDRPPMGSPSQHLGGGRGSGGQQPGPHLRGTPGAKP